MSQERITSFFNKSFKSISRPQREQILCAMIRINYGTPWAGDMQILQNFFPAWFHKNLAFGGLTLLVEALSPFTDDPTEHGVEPVHSSAKSYRSLDTTASISLFTTDVPL